MYMEAIRALVKQEQDKCLKQRDVWKKMYEDEAKERKFWELKCRALEQKLKETEA